MTAPTLLVLRHHGLGDLLTAQPTLLALKRAFPTHRLVCTCPSWLLPLAKYLKTADWWLGEAPNTATQAGPTHHQDVDAALLTNVATQISDGCDLLVSMRTPGLELIPLITALAPRRLVSYHHLALPQTLGFPELDFTDHILKRWRRLLATLEVVPRDEDLVITIEPASEDHGSTIVHVGAGSPSRCWPAERWTEVVRLLMAEGHHVLLTGSGAEEIATATAVAKAAGLSAEHLRCRLGILNLTRLVKGARLVLCTDTGISHLATATGTPAVTLFGPVPPAWWGPPPGYPRHLTLWSGRTGDNYAAEVNPGLLDISADEVLSAVTRLDHADQ